MFSNYNIASIQLLIEDMKKVEQENSKTVQYTFYDGKGSQNLQDTQLIDIVNNKKADIIAIDMVDVAHTKYAIDMIKAFNIPVIIMYNGDEKAVQSYEKAFLARTNPADEGTLQGNIIVDAWNKNRENMDKNKDNILDYIVFIGSPDNIISTTRIKYSVLQINNNNIKSKRIAEKFYYYLPSQIKEDVYQFFLRFGNNIDLIITDEDSAAVNTVKTLQENGYNLDDKEKKIDVVGFGGIPEALDLIKIGAMTGTVPINTYNLANDFYKFELNLFNDKNIIDGTNCTIDYTGKLITFPLEGVSVNLG
ncbi:substrate-binding domain-containing protein [Clostridium sp. DL-VIII]|uniref:substrate-binding domain-containing protein n=1 Tax=Clostridium sp. DL-VIII TaxID=641107 RepID=UPI0002F90DA6|nr:substrate-binding domain-containing protein [Clostridium sp. DL-VIII]